MGAGRFATTLGPAGFDPPEDLTPVSVITPFSADFDQDLRAFPYGEGTGELVEVHAVDQWIELLLGMTRGSLGSSPTVGLDTDSIKKATKSSMLRTITDAVSLALAEPIRKGDITFYGVVLSTNTSANVNWYTDYANNRLPASVAESQRQSRRT